MALMNPIFLRDKKLKATEEITNERFEKLKQIVDEFIPLYTRMDQINDSEILDLLAWQFHIEGYELAQSVKEKRALIKSAIELHRYKGTKYAIKKVLEALGLEGQVKEWFEYNGKPYHFKVDIFAKNKLIEPETEQKLLKLIEQYKNVRSKLEKVSIGYSLGRTFITTAGAFIDQGHEYFAPVVIEENFKGSYTIQTGFIDQGTEVFSNG